MTTYRCNDGKRGGDESLVHELLDAPLQHERQLQTSNVSWSCKIEYTLTRFYDKKLPMVNEKQKPVA